MTKSFGQLQNSHAVDVLPFIVDEYLGVIQSIDWYKPRRTDPQFAYCTAKLGDLSRLTSRPSELMGAGTALKPDEALVKAVGEAIELYCSDMYWPSDVASASYLEISHSDAIDPRRFSLFHPDQYRLDEFPFAAVTENSRLLWVRGFSVTRGKEVWLPLTMVNDSLVSEDSDCFDVAPVSGYASGQNLEEAILRGLYEVIERDSFMIHWYNGLSSPAIDLDSFKSDIVWQTFDRFHSTPVQISCRDITTDTAVPSVLALMYGQYPPWPALVVSAATDVDPVAAVSRALLELASNFLWVDSLLVNHEEQLPQLPEDVTTQENHALYYSDYRKLNDLRGFLRTRTTSSLIDSSGPEGLDVKQCLEQTVRHLATIDMEVTYVDLTTTDVEMLGFKVVKVIVPGAQPIDFGFPRHLGGRRIYEAPRRMGYNLAVTHPSQLNLLPHPFP